MAEEVNFNTSRVRLEVVCLYLVGQQAAEFQYLKGAIRGPRARPLPLRSDRISIPQGCD
mgnify:CR=1 FL=1